MRTFTIDSIARAQRCACTASSVQRVKVWPIVVSALVLLLATPLRLDSAELGRVPNTTLNMPASQQSAQYEVKDAFPGLTFEKPVVIISPPGETNRLFIVEQAGRIQVITNLAEPNLTLFMDISERVYDVSESGLLGMVFHPGYTTNGQFFLFYSLDTSTEEDVEFHNRLARFLISPNDPNQGLSHSEVPLITQLDKNQWHNAGDLHFGPDGYLYLALGDEGGSYDTYRNSQRIDKDFFSGVIRIDVDKRLGSLPPNPHPASTDNYAIPPDNPFVLAAQFNGPPVDPAKVRTEFYVIGLRNPWRMSFDPVTGDLYINDVGQDRWEEVNLAIKGGNYGWRFQEGTWTHTNLVEAAHTNAVYLPPLIEYDHETGNSIAGSLVYRGSRYPEIDEYYIFTDFWHGGIGAFSLAETELNQQLGDLSAELESVRLRLNTTTPELEMAQAQWESGKTIWSILDPALYFSDEGTEFIKLADGSLLASANSSPEIDVYHVIALTEFENINAIRLEALPHETLPNEGPGRYRVNQPFAGNFVLNEFELAASPVIDEGAPDLVRLHSPSADFSQTDWHVSQAIDGDPDSGWGIAPEIGKAHEAIFRTTESIGFDSGTRLTFKLVHNHGDEATLGRFRLSVAHSIVEEEKNRPSFVQNILDTPGAERTEREQAQLASYYRSITLLLEEDRARFLQIQGEIADLLGALKPEISWIGQNRGVSTLGLNPISGDILMANWLNGRIEKLVPLTSSPQEDLPLTLEETGAFANLQTLTPNAGIIPYEINVPFWSDHSHKSRWFTLPDTNLFVHFEESGNWDFPAGSIWIKHFDLELIRGHPESRRRLETRLLVRSTNGLYGVTYRWDESQTNAYLVPKEGMTEEIEVEDGGVVRTQTWRYPSRSECIQCHTDSGGLALGFNTPQLNRNISAPDGPRNQVSLLADMGYFIEPPASPESLLRLVAADDTGESAESRIRSYLFANCVQCHQPGAAGRDSWDARITSNLAETGLIGGIPNDDLGIPGARIVKPGSLEESTLYRRVAELGPGHMPPLATSVVNEEAVALLADWILEELPMRQTEARAEFLGDTIGPQGSWRGAFGEDGHMLAGSDAELPDYVSVGMHGQQTHVWAGSTTETRALELPDGSGRRAATWYSWSDIRVELMIQDGEEHTVALYFVDWGRGGRRQWIEITDPDTGEVLDQRIASEFGEGSYHVWEVAGHVRINIRPISGNAVLGGIFFDTGRHRPPDVALISPAEGAEVLLPDRVPVGAAAEESAIRVDFLLNGTVVESVSEAPFEAFLLDTASGTHTLVARAFNELGLFQTSAPVEFHARRLAGAGLTGHDVTTGGNWSVVYGEGGWIIPNYQTNLPGFVEFSTDNAQPFTWASPTDDERALLRQGVAGRIASTWYSQDSFVVDLHFLDAQFHRTALYFLDWDDAGKALLVEAFDAETGILLEKATVTDFATGRYLIWSLRGHVLIRITSIGGGNAVMSGIFLDPEADDPPGIALTEPESNTIVIAPGRVRLEAGVVDAGEVSRVEFFAGNTKIGTVWSPPFAADWTNLLSGSHALRARAVNHSGLSEFSWPVTIQVQLPPPTVEFVRIDETTRGDWWKHYGLDGSMIPGDEDATPEYARILHISAGESFWEVPSDDERALLFRNQDERIASTWYSETNLNFSLELADGLPHQIGLYLLDWSGNERVQTIEVRDAVDGRVLNFREMEQFGGGVHLVWNMSGHVVIDVQRTAGVNAVVSGLFFDPVGSPYQSWRREVFDVAALRDTLVSGPGADPDEDGMPNVIEFLLAMDPLTYGRLQGAVVDGRFEFEYARRQEAEAFEIYMEASKDLGEWEPAGQYFDKTETELEDVVRTVWRSKLSVLEDEQIFLRMRVEVYE